MSQPISSNGWYTQPGWWAFGVATLSFVLSCVSLYFTWWANYHAKREELARTLLSEGLAVHTLLEAWILEGPAYEEVRLSANRNLQSAPGSSALWLRKVEVRAVLDQAEWTAPEQVFYDFIDGERTWIVRDVVLNGRPSYPMVFARHYRDVKPHPALMSSRAIHELRGWVEKVASAYAEGVLSADRLKMLSPLLEPVSGEDRIKVLEQLLSAEALKFLRWYRAEYVRPP